MVVTLPLAPRRFWIKSCALDGSQNLSEKKSRLLNLEFEFDVPKNHATVAAATKVPGGHFDT